MKKVLKALRKTLLITALATMLMLVLIAVGIGIISGLEYIGSTNAALNACIAMGIIGILGMAVTFFVLEIIDEY
jgi:hypothetical protein